MGPHKHPHHHYGGKRHKSTGVADYFAVLGMDVDDNSFLLRGPQPPPNIMAPPAAAAPSALSVDDDVVVGGGEGKGGMKMKYLLIWIVV